MAFVAILVALALTAGVASGAPQPASRIVDRTMLCNTYGAGYPDPLRIMKVLAVPNQAQATNGPQGSPRFVVAQIRLGGAGQDQVVVSRAACAASSVPVKLSPDGLRSGETEFGNKWRCPVPASVLIRVRAAFSWPVTLTQAPDANYLLIATGRISSGSLAIATKGKTPIAFATVDKSGRSSISVARPRCQRDRS